jgi:hypothetical protein
MVENLESSSRLIWGRSEDLDVPGALRRRRWNKNHQVSADGNGSSRKSKRSGRCMKTLLVEILLDGKGEYGRLYQKIKVYLSTRCISRYLVSIYTHYTA